MNIDRTGCAGKYHGNMTAYTRYGCRCLDAREDKRIYVKLGQLGLRAPRLVDGVGTQRRLRALAAIGWTHADIAAHMGKSMSAVERMARCCGPRVRVVTAEAVKQVYEKLSMTPGPSALVRMHAERHGWPPPLAWDDDLIDDPDATPHLGVRRARARADVAEDARFLAGTGMTTRGIAARLGVSEHYVRALLNAREVAA
jgi:hypothetical protein